MYKDIYLPQEQLDNYRATIDIMTDIRKNNKIRQGKMEALDLIKPLRLLLSNMTYQDILFMQEQGYIKNIKNITINPETNKISDMLYVDIYSTNYSYFGVVYLALGGYEDFTPKFVISANSEQQLLKDFKYYI